jgi:hypothetical protein
MAITPRQRKTALQKLGARARGTPPPGYPKQRARYADPKRLKYPVESPARVRAAIAYFGDPKNREGYSEAEQRSVARRIVAAARGFKIAVDPASAVGRLAGVKAGAGGNPRRQRRQGAVSRVRGRLKRGK